MVDAARKVLVVMALLAGVSACRGPRDGQGWIKVLAGPEEVEAADSLEAMFRARSDTPPPAGSPWFAVLHGSAPILVTAPHATRPLRNGQSRFADRGTGSLAVMLHRLSATTALHTTWASPVDPNDTDSCAFKDSLAVLLKSAKPRVVLDLHASGAERPYDVDFGTMRGASIKADTTLLVMLSEALRRSGLTSQSRDFFKAEHKGTVTRFVSSRGVPCIQLEINAVWLRPDGDGADRHRFAQLLNGLAAFIEETRGRSR